MESWEISSMSLHNSPNSQHQSFAAFVVHFSLDLSSLDGISQLNLVRL
jgi:hypothetical protein